MHPAEMLEYPGRRAMVFIGAVVDIFRMIATLFIHGGVVAALRRRAVMTVFLRQIYFTAYQAVPVVTFLALVIGVAIIAQIIGLAGHGSEALTGRTLVWVIVRGVGPLLAAIIVVARSGTAVAAELGTMQVTGEIESLRLMGIDPSVYLLAPRVLGMVMSALILVLYFEIAAILGGVLVASLALGIPFGVYSMGVISSLTLLDILMSFAKGILFGLGIAAICCAQGMNAGSSLTAVPQVATRAVMRSLLLVFIADAAVSFLFFYA